MPIQVIPDKCDVAVEARLGMATERGSPALHDSPGRFANMRRQRMYLLCRGKRVVEDGLERHEGHRYRRTRLVLWQQGSVPYSITPTIPATSGESNVIWTSDTRSSSLRGLWRQRWPVHWLTMHEQLTLGIARLALIDVPIEHEIVLFDEAAELLVRYRGRQRIEGRLREAGRQTTSPHS